MAGTWSYRRKNYKSLVKRKKKKDRLNCYRRANIQKYSNINNRHTPEYNIMLLILTYHHSDMSLFINHESDVVVFSPEQIM